VQVRILTLQLKFAARGPIRVGEVRSVNFSGRRVLTGRSAIAVCALLMVGVTVLRFAVSNPIEAVGFLYVIPISLAAVEFGYRGGLAAAASAILLTVFWAELQNVPLGVVGYGTRGFTFTSIGLLVGLQAEQRRTLLEERERLVDKLRATAMRDQLTGLANRRASDERLAYELRTAGRSARPLSVAVVDLDKLKLVNDSYGHAQGDRLIQRCAQALRIAARETDLIARLGGDEFLVLLPDCRATEAREVALRLLDALRPDHSASIGIATWDRQEPADELISRADQAMYTAKMAGGARITLAPEPPQSRPLLAAI
jgi:diguanylate cyclase (GGDEF)-like protein